MSRPAGRLFYSRVADIIRRACLFLGVVVNPNENDRPELIDLRPRIGHTSEPRRKVLNFGHLGRSRGS